MAALKLKKYPDPILRSKSRDILGVGDEEKALLDDMAETMYANGGIGLAAPQIGVSKRLIVLDIGGGLLKMINPKILSKKGKSAMEEGCLSVPDKTVEVERAEVISVSYVDEKNDRSVKNLGALAAKAVQHEIDHLDGKLIIDYLPWHKKIFLKKGGKKCLL